MLLLSDLNLPGLKVCYFWLYHFIAYSVVQFFGRLCNYVIRGGSVVYCGYFVFPVCGFCKFIYM